jgi:hypothetical protein
MRIDLATLVPALKTQCGYGVGLAVCPTLGLLVTSCWGDNTLSVFTLPRNSGVGAGAVAGAGAGTGLALVCTLGGASSPAPMQFGFFDGSAAFSGWMAFTGPATARRLLLTDAGHDAVHIIDVAGRVHVGHVTAPGTIIGPRGVAARGSMVAVSAWQQQDSDSDSDSDSDPEWDPRQHSSDYKVLLFYGSGTSWTLVRVMRADCGGPRCTALCNQLVEPYGLRFTADGRGLVVSSKFKLSMFHVKDGSFVRHLATGLHGARDVEECEGGWLVTCGQSWTIEFVSELEGADGGGASADRPRLDRSGDRDTDLMFPSALAVVPGLGLVVREGGDSKRLQFFASPDVIAMASMSPCRVAWMAGVARGAGARARAVSVAVTVKAGRKAGPAGGSACVA